MEEIKDIFYKPLCPVMMLDTRLFISSVLVSSGNEEIIWKIQQPHRTVTVHMLMLQSVKLAWSHQLRENQSSCTTYNSAFIATTSAKWQLDHIMHWAHVDSVKRLFISLPAVTEVKLLNNHRACSFFTDGSPKEQQSVAGFGGWRDAAVPVWLGKQSWRLICPTPLQKRGCNSIGSWPTVPPLAGTAAQALLKKPHWGNVPASAPLSKRHAGCATPRVLVLSFSFLFFLKKKNQIEFHSAIYHRGHISCNESAENVGGRWFLVDLL